MNRERPDVQAGFRKGQRSQRSNYWHPLDHRKSKRIPENHLLVLYWLHQSLWLYRSQQTGKFFAAKSLQSCPILCDPIDGSPPGSTVPGILQARTLEWVAISFSNAWKWKVKVKLLSCVRLLAAPRTAAYQAPPAMGFSRQEYWSGLPVPFPGKFFKRWGYQTTLPASRDICIQVKKPQLELDMEQKTGSKLEKEYVKAVYCHPAYLTCMQSTSCKMPGWMKHKLESRLPGEISITSDTRWHYHYGIKWRRTKEPLDESERGEWKSWLKAQHLKNWNHGIQSHHSMQIDGETMETVMRLYFWGLQNHCRWWLQPWN